MPDNPISNPGVSPASPVPPYGPENPRLGANEEGQEPKPFQLGPQGEPPKPSESENTAPSPMKAAGDAARQGQQQANPEELGEQIQKLHSQFSTIHQQLQTSTVTQKFTADHYLALQKITDKMTPDMQTIAKSSNGTFDVPQKTPGQGVLTYVTNWLNSGQETLTGALSNLQNADFSKGPNIEGMLRLQYAMQRATQKGELFASIVGASVSGIKTIMSTQLG